MSAIFGIMHLDGRPVSRAAGERMRAHLAPWGPDGGGIWHQAEAVLGHTLLCSTPEARYETMPLYDEARQTVLVATARLDNRAELCDTFAIPTAARPGTPDGWLLWCAYRHWGTACPQHLCGDWSLAVWQQQERRLFLARDQLGSTGLFYCYRPPLLAFASGCEALLALAEISPRLDEGRLVRYLAMLPGGDPAQTMWDNIRFLLPAHTLSATLRDIRLAPYWRLADAPSVRLSSDADYIEGFLEHYRAAVQSRLRSLRPVGTTLSAGLDSGSVTTLAAAALRASGAALLAFTSVPAYPATPLAPGGLADEWPLAHAVAQQWDNITHLALRADTASPLVALERSLAIYPQPLHTAANLYWLVALFTEAQRYGLGVMLLGQLGNGSISWSGGRHHIFSLFANGDWRAGKRALAAWRTHHGQSWWTAVRRQLLGPVLRPFWEQRLRLRQLGIAPWASYAAIQPALAQRTGLHAMLRASQRAALWAGPLTPTQERAAYFAAHVRSTGPVQHAYGAAFGLDIRDPTADVRLLEYCLGVPAEQYTSAGGERMLVRRAMTGLLPPQVQWNRQRGQQAADVVWRLLAYPQAMEATLRRLEATPEVTEYIECQALRRAWQAVQSRVTPQTTRQATTLLLRGVMAGLFIAGGTTRA